MSWSSNVSTSVTLCADLQLVGLSFSLTFIVLVLPPVVSILYLGSKRCRRQRAVMSHSDFFTYNSAVFELIGLVGCLVTVGGFLFGAPRPFYWQMIYLNTFLWFGQMIFPILTCVDRYLAVVHPITYLRLRQGAGVRIRNAGSAIVWLLAISGPVLIFLMEEDVTIMHLLSMCELFVFLAVMLFCSLSVLWVLIRPRPGEGGGDRQRVHRSKQRAFRTILIIMGVLLLRFGGTLVSNWLSTLQQMTVRSRCVTLLVGPWMVLPSSLALPLLFLHKAGKLPGFWMRPGPDHRSPIRG